MLAGPVLGRLYLAMQVRSAQHIPHRSVVTRSDRRAESQSEMVLRVRAQTPNVETQDFQAHRSSVTSMGAQPIPVQLGTWGSTASDHQRTATMQRHDRQLETERTLYPVSLG